MMTETVDEKRARLGRKTGLIIAVTGTFWVLATVFGSKAGLSHRALALFDLIALAGFIYAILMIYTIWQLRRDNEG